MSDVVFDVAGSVIPCVSIALAMAFVILSWLKSTTVPSLFLILEIPLTVIIRSLLVPIPAWAKPSYPRPMKNANIGRGSQL